jgi:hypothetical protein
MILDECEIAIALIVVSDALLGSFVLTEDCDIETLEEVSIGRGRCSILTSS